MSTFPVPFPLWYVVNPVGRWVGELLYPGPAGPPASPLFSTTGGVRAFLKARPAYDHYTTGYAEDAAQLLDHLDALERVRVARVVLDPGTAGERWFAVADLRAAATMAASQARRTTRAEAS